MKLKKKRSASFLSHSLNRRERTLKEGNKSSKGDTPIELLSTVFLLPSFFLSFKIFHFSFSFSFSNFSFTHFFFFHPFPISFFFFFKILKKTGRKKENFSTYKHPHFVNLQLQEEPTFIFVSHKTQQHTLPSTQYFILSNTKHYE